MITINYYSSLTNATVVSGIASCAWFDLIKNSSYSSQIIKARNGETNYNETKCSLPCVTYNFYFNEYKCNANILSSTGLLYIDIDSSDFNIQNLNISKVYSFYRSFGGSGYAIILKINGLTFENFKSTYLDVCRDLNLLAFIDFNAIKPTQFNVISYDENIFINDNCYIYTATTLSSPFIKYNTPHSSVLLKKRIAYTQERGASGNEKIFYPVRFNNLDEIKIDGDYIVNWDGVEFVNCFVPMKKKSSNRNAFLLSYTNNLVWLNGPITKERTIKLISAVNEVVCYPQVDINQIKRVVDSIFKEKIAGTLKPIVNRKKRKIIFNKQCKISKEDKMNVVITELAKKKRNESLLKLHAIIEQWNFENSGQISQQKIYSNHPISKKTVEKYWANFKEFIQALNDTYKMNGKR